MLASGAPWSSREAMDSWLVPHLFGQAYLRKPPGMVWAIAASQATLGEHSPLRLSDTVASRLVSAFATILGALIVYAFGSRWFGRVAGFIGGCAWALFPVWYWYPPPALSAEIEALNNLFVLATSLALFDVLLWSRRREPSGRITSFLAHAFLAITFAAMLLTKGPAGVPTLLAVMIACVWGRAQNITPRPAPRRDWLTVAAALLCGALVFAAWMFAARGALARSGETPVTQEFTQFLFTPQKLFGIVSLPIAAIISALPHTAFFSVFLRPSQALRACIDPLVRQQAVLARAIAIAVVVGVLLSMLLGVSNSRYTLPTLALVPVVVGGACWWLLERANQAESDTTARSLRKSLSNTLTILAAMLLIACVGLGVYAEHRRTVRTTGETDGMRTGAAIVANFQPGLPADSRKGAALAEAFKKHPNPIIELWGDEMLDIRPEIAMSAAREARTHGVVIVPKWKPLSLVGTAGDNSLVPPLPPAGNFVLLRTDSKPREPGRIEELPAYERAGLMAQLRAVFKGTAHDFEYTLYVVVPSISQPANEIGRQSGIKTMDHTQSIRDFWQWFASHQVALEKMQDTASPFWDEVLARLQRVDSGLWFEVSGPVNNVREFVITAGGNETLFTLVDTLVAHAPQIHGWQPVALKPPQGFEFRTVYENVAYDPRHVWFMPLQSKNKPTFLGVRVAIPNLPAKAAGSPDNALAAVLMILDTGLGERSAALDINHVEVERLPEDPEAKGYIELPELADYIIWHRRKAAE